PCPCLRGASRTAMRLRGGMGKGKGRGMFMNGVVPRYDAPTMPVPVPRERVVQIFHKAGGRPLKAKDVGKGLGLHADDRSEVRDLLRFLTDDGVLVQLEGKRYVLAGASNAHKGAVQRKATGSGWFIPDDK